MKHLIFSIALLPALVQTAFSAQGKATEILKPSYQCQSQEFAADDSIHAVVLKDDMSNQGRIDIARTWFGGVQKSSHQVKELVSTGLPGVPRIYEGDGLRLSIQSALNANEQYLSATLSTQIDERTTQNDTLICLPF